MAITINVQMPGRYLVTGSKHRVAESFDELIEILEMECSDRSYTAKSLRDEVNSLKDAMDEAGVDYY